MATKYPDFLKEFRCKEGHLTIDSKAEIIKEILDKKFSGKIKTKTLYAEKTVKVFDYQERKTGTFVLFQTERKIIEEGKQYPKKKICYVISEIRGGEVVSEVMPQATGQNIHFYIRNGMSPLRYINEKEGL